MEVQPVAGDLWIISPEPSKRKEGGVYVCLGQGRMCVWARGRGQVRREVARGGVVLTFVPAEPGDGIRFVKAEGPSPRQIWAADWVL